MLSTTQYVPLVVSDYEERSDGNNCIKLDKYQSRREIVEIWH